eukprot:TRINITY_DN1664_c0_g1_i1.p2 TRINITY_DN1664_c0_g1~~TRINITY_DN1664_c0_g1_i1.p2  ORF type:complete len:210 (+),score=41.56 TRINITY_DN1664_c0_g1_i1:773-1402(+)
MVFVRSSLSEFRGRWQATHIVSPDDFGREGHRNFHGPNISPGSVRLLAEGHVHTALNTAKGEPFAKIGLVHLLRCMQQLHLLARAGYSATAREVPELGRRQLLLSRLLRDSIAAGVCCVCGRAGEGASSPFCEEHSNRVAVAELAGLRLPLYEQEPPDEREETADDTRVDAAFGGFDFDCDLKRWCAPAAVPIVVALQQAQSQHTGRRF